MSSLFETEKLQRKIDEIINRCKAEHVPAAEKLEELEKRLNFNNRERIQINKETGKFQVTQANKKGRFFFGPSSMSNAAANGFKVGYNFPIQEGKIDSVTIALSMNTFSASVSAKINQIAKELTDFEKKKIFTFNSLEFAFERSSLFHMKSKSAGFNLTLNTKKLLSENKFSLQFVEEKSDKNSPLPLKYEPDNYCLLSASSELHQLKWLVPKFTVGVVSEKDEKFNPFFAFKCNASIKLPFDFKFTLDTGIIQSLCAKKGCSYQLGSTLPLPYPMKYHLGGVKSAPGISPATFGYRYGTTPTGSDAFLVTSLYTETKKYTKLNLQGVLFLTTTIAKNFSSYCLTSLDPDATLSCVGGAGIRRNGRWTIYLNSQVQLLQQGAENKFYNIQFGIVSNEN